VLVDENSASDAAASCALIFIFYFQVTAYGVGIQLYGGMDWDGTSTDWTLVGLNRIGSNLTS
jgi:hypothetical protein